MNRASAEQIKKNAAIIAVLIAEIDTEYRGDLLVKVAESLRGASLYATSAYIEQAGIAYGLAPPG